MPCQNTISPRDNKWNWECWYGGLKIDNLRSWFFGPPSSNQCLLFQFYSIPTPCWMSLWDWNYPITPKTAASCHWERTTQCKKCIKSSAAEYTTHTLTRPSISLPWKTLHTQTRANTHSHNCRHTDTLKHPSQRNTEARKRQGIWLLKHFPCNSWEKKTTDNFYSV